MLGPVILGPRDRPSTSTLDCIASPNIRTKNSKRLRRLLLLGLIFGRQETWRPNNNRAKIINGLRPFLILDLLLLGRPRGPNTRAKNIIGLRPIILLALVLGRSDGPILGTLVLGPRILGPPALILFGLELGALVLGLRLILGQILLGQIIKASGFYSWP